MRCTFGTTRKLLFFVQLFHVARQTPYFFPSQQLNYCFSILKKKGYCSEIILRRYMVRRKDFIHPKSPKECDSLQNIEDEFEEYIEEEMSSQEESDQNIYKQASKEDSSEVRYLVEGSSAENANVVDSSDEESPEEVQCEEKPDGEDSFAEDSDEEPYEDGESEEDLKEGTTPEETSERPGEAHPTADVTFDEMVEEELSEESEEEHDGEESFRCFMYKQPNCNDSGVVSVCLPEEKKASDHRFSESLGNQCSRKSENLSTDATVSKQVDVAGTSSKKKRRSRWDIKAEDPILVKECGDLNKRRRTRWSSEEAPLIMSDSLKLLSYVKNTSSCNADVRRIRKLQTKLQLINQKLAAIVIVDEQPREKCTPSPPPIDDSLGISMNTTRLRSKLIEQKNNILLELLANFKKQPMELLTSCKKQPTSRPLPDQFPVICKKLYIPSKEYPSYNFIGLIIGPQGKTQKKMEEETGAKIRLRGRGSKHKEEEDPNDEDLHVLIEAASQASVDAAVSMVERLLVPVDDQYNYHKATQLRELAALRGTLREGRAFKMDPCDICGSSSHATSDCPLTATTLQTKTNFLTGSGSLFSSFKSPSISPSPVQLADKMDGSKLEKEIDEANLYVGYLPQTLSDDKLEELFLPFGTLCEVHVIKDRNTGQSKGYGFVKYTNAIDAAKAIAQMNGYLIDGKRLAVRVSGIPLPSSNANLPNHVVAGTSSNAHLSNYIAGTLPPPKKEIDLSGLYVGYLPQTVSDDKLKELFLPFGTCEAKVMNDRNTGQSKGYGFVKYTSASDAAKAIAQMNGYSIDGKWLAVRVAGILPSPDKNLSNNVMAGASLNANQPNYRVAGTLPPYSWNVNLPLYPGFAAISPGIRDPNNWPGPPGSMLPESVSNELASFPGYLKSFAPPKLFDQSAPPKLFDQSAPSSIVSSKPPSLTGSLFSNQINPTWR